MLFRSAYRKFFVYVLPESLEPNSLVQLLSTDYKFAVSFSILVIVLLFRPSPGCPVAGILPQQVADAAASVEGTGEIEVTLVWDPPWDTEKMSEDAKLALGMY